MSVCKQCGYPVIWVKIEGRWHCHNESDGADHWDLCSKVRWEKTKATGIRFDSKAAAGYANSVHGTKFERLNAKVKRGSRFKRHILCRECVPAWEDCPNNCPLAIHSNDLGVSLEQDQLAHLRDIR